MAAFLQSHLLAKYSPFPLINIETKSSALQFLSTISEGKCFPKLLGYLVSDPDRFAFIENSEQDAPRSILLPFQYQRSPISIFQSKVRVWNSFLGEVTESNTMTEKGSVIHSAGSKCEPRLQGQSNLMLQERK